MRVRLLLFLLAATLLAAAAPQLRAEDSNVTRATLPNGMKVVIIQNKLAPVATVEANFMVGGNETPEGFPGMAHAQEHMAFRGCKGMTADQTAAIYALLGGENNADTQQNITQYFATVPSADVDVALEAQAACLRGVDDSQAEWDQERGAIEQEVAARPVESNVQVRRPAERGSVCRNAVRARSAGHAGVVRQDDGRDAEGVLRQVVHAVEHDPDRGGRCGSGGDAGDDQADCMADIPSHPLPAHAEGRSAAVQAGDLHARQQSALRAGIHCVSDAGDGFAGLRGDEYSGGRAGQPAGGFVRDGSGGEGAGGGVRAGGDVSAKQVSAMVWWRCLRDRMRRRHFRRCGRS